MLLFRHIRRCLHHQLYTHEIKHSAKKCLYKDETFVVSCQSSITIYSDIFVKVKAMDIIKVPSTDKLQVQLLGTNCKKPTADVTVKIEGEKTKTVEIVCKKLDENSDWHLELEVPSMASIIISAGGSAYVKNVFGSMEIRVAANNDILTRNINSKLVELISAEGDIECLGFFGGEKTIVQTGSCGNISIQKIQGSDVECKTTQGNILVESSYALNTKFSTQTGKIDLRNFHKKVQVFIHKTGDLIITAFNGIVNATSHGGRIILDLIQVKEQNVINANATEKATVFISPTVEHTANIKISGCFVMIEPELEHLCKSLNEDRNVFELSSVKNKQTTFIFNAGAADINLGRISWFKSMRLAYSLDKK